MTVACKKNESLLSRVARGDSDAMTTLLERYGGLLYSLARRALAAQCLGEIDDAVQEVTIAIWQSAHRFRQGKGAETTFISTIARRRLIDYRRRHAARQQVGASRDPAGFTPLAAPKDPPGASVEDLQPSLAKLRPEQRTVLELSMGRGCTNDQVAKALGWPLGTVKSHARRGLMIARRHPSAESESNGNDIAIAC